jgi:hypothetical protein
MARFQWSIAPDEGGVYMRKIVNKDLTLSNIPNPDVSWFEIGGFALTFDGYDVWGSFDKCAEIANARRHESLTVLRTCLFFEQRRWRHFEENPDEETMVYIRGLVEAIRSMVDAGDLA